MSSISGIGGGIGGGGSGLSGAAGLREIMELRRQIIDKSQVLQQVHAPQGQIAATGSSSSANANGAQGFTSALGDALNNVNASQTRADQITSAYETGQTQDVARGFVIGRVDGQGQLEFAGGLFEVTPAGVLPPQPVMHPRALRRGL